MKFACETVQKNLRVKRSGVLGVEMKTLPVKHKHARSPDPQARGPLSRKTAAAGAVQHNTTHAWSPDPQARGTLSLWTGAWPTQPAITHYM